MVAKNILIGLFVLSALAIIVFILLFLHPTIGDSGKTIRVRFTDIDKVNVGTRVTYAGLPVGEVVDIEELTDARTGRMSRLGNIYVYELTLQIDSAVQVYNTDLITVRTSGLLGEKNVSIMPQALKPGERLYLIDHEVMYAEPSASVEDTLKEFSHLSQKIEKVLDEIYLTAEQVNKEQIVAKISQSVQNISDITGTLNQPDKWQNIVNNVLLLTERANHSWTTVDSILKNAYHLTERAQGSLTTLDRSFHTLDHSFNTLNGAFGKFDRLVERGHSSWGTVDSAFAEFKQGMVNIRESTEQIKQVVGFATSGRGTIGRLFIDEELYLRLKSILSKGETIANDISHYGVLFHLNKSWQRLNARRLNLLAKLSQPRHFSEYFTKELEEISSSLSRVSLVLDESECYPQTLIDNPEFKKRYSELLKQVEKIDESLKMYNQQVMDQECMNPAW
jgi:phospholipid/cholesterol/gamma-HCH transport system substrate-binding protein